MAEGSPRWFFESLIYRKALFALYWAQENGGRKPGYLPKVCFSRGGVSGWWMERNQPSETPNQDMREVAMSRRLGPKVGTLSLMNSSKPTLWGHPGQRGCSAHRSKTSRDNWECWMHNGWAVCSAGSSVPQKKQKGIYIAAVQVTVASSLSQADGQIAGGLAGWARATVSCSTVCWFVETPSLLREAYRLT